MSARMVEFWTNFANTGDVNQAPVNASRTNTSLAGLKWPKFEGDTRPNMRLGTTMGVESTKTGQPGTLPTKGVCDFFDNVIGYNH